MFRLLRLFSVISFICIVVTATLLALFYRKETIRETVRLAQVGNLALAQSTLIAVRPEFDELLAIAAGVGPRELPAQRLSARIAEVLSEVRRDALVVKVKLYNRRGMVAYSTDHSQIGQNQAGNAGFMSAVNGRVGSTLKYYDVFSRFADRAVDTNLMQTHIPVRNAATGSIEGVFEIYTDVTPLVSANERAVFVILAGVGLILMALYTVLILVIRRARRVIETQQNTISERTAALETLSAAMLRSEEMEKKKVAFGLHEGIAQTLSAVKVRIENSLGQIDASKENDGSLSSIVPVLQSTIRDVQSIATGLRPSSLDDLGLLPTIDWFCREFEHQHPEITIEQNISLRENDTPKALKVVIYRIVESVLTSIHRNESADNIELKLKLAAGVLSLEIDSTARDSLYAANANRDSDFALQMRFAEAQERTSLSGGRFRISRNKSGGVALRAAWAA